jgi:hypothetical protein
MVGTSPMQKWVAESEVSEKKCMHSSSRLGGRTEIIRRSVAQVPEPHTHLQFRLHFFPESFTNQCCEKFMLVAAYWGNRRVDTAKIRTWAKHYKSELCTFERSKAWISLVSFYCPLHSSQSTNSWLPEYMESNQFHRTNSCHLQPTKLVF